jgi:hypothetical protein
MKKLLISCIFLIITVFLFAQEKDSAVFYTNGVIYGTSSVSYIPQTDYNLSFGFDALFINMDNIDIPPPIYIGIEYKWNFANDDNSNILKWNFRFVPFNDIYYGILWFPIGLNMAYNFNQNNFSMGPSISCQVNLFLDLFISLDYSYNFMINDYKKNYHQIAFKFGVNIFGLRDFIYDIFGWE